MFGISIAGGATLRLAGIPDGFGRGVVGLMLSRGDGRTALALPLEQEGLPCRVLPEANFRTSIE